MANTARAAEGQDHAQCLDCGAEAGLFAVQPPGLKLFRCRGCRLIFVPIKYEHGQQYHESRLTNVDPETDTWNALGFLTHWRSRLRWPTGLRLLDVGCADGRLLEVARMLGISGNGVEITDFYEAQWRARGIDALVGDIGQIPGPFDAVVARQVIEHVARPSAFIANMARLLTPGGSALIETGDPDSLQARLSGARWSYWIPAEGVGAHVSFVGRQTAATYGQWAGLELKGSVPSFKYRPFVSYRRGRNLINATVGYALHRTALSGGRCYWFRKPA
jgi:SAM-dependent methyltransferase